MVRPEEQEDAEQDALDPAAERVRRKMVRFMAINLAILFAAVMAVVLAFVYKTLKDRPEEPAEMVMIPGDATESTIELPDGARVVSQALDGTRVSLHLRYAGGREELRIFDVASGTMAARIELRP
ncbi:fimbrial protein [Nitratireductor sp. GISD-1A_MAKvit]|uniref:fimbrial protein n=1 Tax=Nitratireductor sp. GISD-1A_MAKvit TaxID=3234198 RepID=UPI003466341F